MCGGGGQQVPETPEARALAEIASQRYEQYKSRFIPIENIAINKTTGDLINPPQIAQNVANIGTQTQFSNAQPGVTANLATRGARPGSGAFGLNMAGFNTDRAVSTGLGQANASGLQRTQALQNMQNMVNIGQGQAGATLTGYGSLADAAARQSFIDAQAAAAARGAIGQTVGAGLGAYYGTANRTPGLTPPASSGGYSGPPPGAYTGPQAPP